MAKRASKKTTSVAEYDGGISDGLRNGLQAMLVRHIGAAQILTHSEAERRLNGVALPCLLLRWLIGQDALPLGRVLALAGAEGSNKTAFSWEVGRWLSYYKGSVAYADAERRDSPDLRAGIWFERDAAFLDSHVLSFPASAQEEWQAFLTHAMDVFLKDAKQRKSPCCHPVACVADSVAAVAPRKRVDDLRDAGGAGAKNYSGATIAAINKEWLQAVQETYTSGPFLLVLIQHTTDAFGGDEKGAFQMLRPDHEKKRHAGGKEIAYIKSLHFELSRGGDRTESKYAVRDIRFACDKNSLGMTGRKISVPFITWHVAREDGPGTRPRMMWDWHGATISFLLNYMTNTKIAAQKRNAVRDITGLRNENKTTCYSRELGISASDALPNSVVGEMLEYEHPQKLVELYDVLGICRRAVLPPGALYTTLWDPSVTVPQLPSVVPYPRRFENGLPWLAGLTPEPTEEADSDDE